MNYRKSFSIRPKKQHAPILTIEENQQLGYLLEETRRNIGSLDWDGTTKVNQRQSIYKLTYDKLGELKCLLDDIAWIEYEKEITKLNPEGDIVNIIGFWYYGSHRMEGERNETSENHRR